jgi:drug/metabolite transporter (DMT)-like permease
MTGLFSHMGLGELLAIGASLTYSVSLIAVRQGVRSATPIAGVLIWNIVVAVSGLIYAFIKGTLQTSSVTPVLLFMLGGCIGQGFGQLTNVIGIQRMGVSRSVPIQSSTPLFSLFFAIIFLGERPGMAVWLGTIFIVAGVSLLSVSEGEENVRFKDFFQGSLIYPIVSAIAYGILPIIVNFAFAYQRTPIVGFACAFSAGSLFLLATRSILPGGDRLYADRRAWGWFLFAAGTNTIAAAFFWTAMSIAPVSTVLPLSRLVPLWVLLWTYLFLAKLERITLRIVCAAGMVVLGGVFITMFR